jgi:hypothetical protein
MFRWTIGIVAQNRQYFVVGKSPVDHFSNDVPAGCAAIAGVWLL